MTGKEFLHKLKVQAKAGFCSSAPETEEEVKGITAREVSQGYHLVKGKGNHGMEDYLVSTFKMVDDKELGLFAIFDGHMGHDVASYLQTHLFPNILSQEDFWSDTKNAIRRAYVKTDNEILEQVPSLGRGGSTAVTAILINRYKLVVANVGDSRAVISKSGVADQLSVDHEPAKEKEDIEKRGGFVSNLLGDVARVDGQLAVARAFGDKSLKKHLSSEPDFRVEIIDEYTEFVILASDGLWKVMTNQEAVDSIRHIQNTEAAAKHLADEAVCRKSRDDISCIVVRFH